MAKDKTDFPTVGSSSRSWSGHLGAYLGFCFIWWGGWVNRFTWGGELSQKFVKLHMALDGQTPAQAAGIELEGKNKWVGLLESAFGDG